MNSSILLIENRGLKMPCIINSNGEKISLLNGEVYIGEGQICAEDTLNKEELLINDTLVHKYYVWQSGLKLSSELERLGIAHSKIMRLLYRCKVYDNSKLTEINERKALESIADDTSCLGNAHSVIDGYKRSAIEMHWRNNTHHPEHFSSYEFMSELDILEMICDWYAR